MSRQGALDDVAPLWDKWDYMFGLAISVILLTAGIVVVHSVWNGSPSVGSLAINGALVFITAGTIFLAQYRHRHRRRDIPIVRPSFTDCAEGQYDGFGLKNFGPGPACYVQVMVEFPDGETEEMLNPRSKPINLEEGKAVELFHNTSLDSSPLKVLITGLQSNREIKFYYTFESGRGHRWPPFVEGETERGDENLLENLKHDWERAHKISVRNLRRNCLSESEASVE